MELLLKVLRNVKKGWLTTTIGVVLMLACFVSVFFFNWTWDKATVGLTVAFTLLGMPDPNFDKPPSIYILLLLIALQLLVLSMGCKRILLQSQTSKDSTVVKYTKDTIVVKGDIVQVTINQDSIIQVLEQRLKNGLKPEIVYQNPQNAAQRIVLKLDKSGKLQADCIADDRLIEYLEKEVYRLQSNTSYKEKIVHRIPQWVYFAMVAMAIFSLLTILLLALKIF